MSKYIAGLILMGTMLCVSCKSSKSTATPAEIEALSLLVESKDFNIESNWAYPQTTYAMQQVLNSGLLFPNNGGSAINLIGNPNFLKISGDSISSFLPYFGERQMQITYNGQDTAIQLNGLMENYEIAEGKNNSYNISFSANSAVNNERFRVFITLFPNLKSNIRVNSTGRFSIGYSGEIVEETLE
ncbi:DUF4251 domain-containing protein [Hyunsoonleella rubra]|uniref:DUF4251 domain-containing protein n=1 Tax=Hyunsoonleella rubra TaxID=1737062 RepID=A0ABW5TDA3_9FLAO